MKKFILFICLLCFSTILFAQDYTAVTYNLRLNLESDASNWWEYRKERLANQLEYLSPDVFGIQEGLHEQITYLDQRFPNFSYTGVGREDGKTAGEYAAIFYDTTTFTIQKSGNFWLSETPDTPSKGWDANYIRICTYALFYNAETSEYIWIFNTHLDHEAQKARLESVKLIQQKIQELNAEGYPVVLMGDFNAVPDSEPITYITGFMQDTRTISKTKPEGPVGTFNGFNIAHPLDRRIDYIFVSEEIYVHSYQVHVETSYSHYPSDHLPVAIGFTIE
ncbi:MAG: endonuclease/exonuclease/phosphatase family protein [Balneolaceae bacterium]